MELCQVCYLELSYSSMLCSKVVDFSCLVCGLGDICRINLTRINVNELSNQFKLATETVLDQDLKYTNNKWIHKDCIKYLNLQATINMFKNKYNNLKSKIDIDNYFECELCGISKGLLIKCAVLGCCNYSHILCGQIKFRILNTTISIENINRNVPVSFSQ